MAKDTPAVPKELVEWLEKHFPDRCPEIAESNRTIWMNAGATRVVKKLRKLYETQTTRVLE